MTTLTLVLGDITEQSVDVIVNAANSGLLGGGGVDGAIHRAAGPRLLDACRDLRATSHPDGLPTGGAVATGAFELPATWVIHVVGPVWSAEDAAERRPLLTACYVNALELADELGARTIAFPAVSAGIYGWPADDAARTAVAAVRGASTSLEEIRFALFGQRVYDAFAAAL